MLPICLSLKPGEDFTPKVVVKIKRHNECRLVGTVPGRRVLGQLSQLSLVFLLLLLLSLESFQPSRGGKVIVLAAERENTTKGPNDRFMILVTVVRERVYGVKGKG